jgi:hypothetical protein
MTKAILLLSAAVFLLPNPAHGERIQQQPLAPQEIPIIPITHEVTMFVGQITSFRSAERFKSIVLKGDVVNIEAQSDKDVVITAKAAGSEQIMMVGEQGETVANLLVNVSALERHSVHIHSKLGNVHAYWAYNCPPGRSCYRIEDKLEGEDRVPPPTVVVLPTASLPRRY